MVGLRTEMVATTTLTASEDVQDESKIDAIVAAMSDFEAVGADWREIPAIVIDEAGVIIDGHHRVAAANACGLCRWRAIVVDRGAFDARVEAVGWMGALREAVDDVGDYVTWGAL